MFGINNINEKYIYKTWIPPTLLSEKSPRHALYQLIMLIYNTNGIFCFYADVITNTINNGYYKQKVTSLNLLTT